MTWHADVAGDLVGPGFRIFSHYTSEKKISPEGRGGTRRWGVRRPIDGSPDPMVERVSGYNTSSIVAADLELGKLARDRLEVVVEEDLVAWLR